MTQHEVYKTIQEKQILEKKLKDALDLILDIKTNGKWEAQYDERLNDLNSSQYNSEDLPGIIEHNKNAMDKINSIAERIDQLIVQIREAKTIEASHGIQHINMMRIFTGCLKNIK